MKRALSALRVEAWLSTSEVAGKIHKPTHSAANYLNGLYGKRRVDRRRRGAVEWEWRRIK
jgi:hypothetical protein